MEDSKPILPQIHEYETLVSEILAEGMKMYEYLQVGVLVKKLPLSYKRIIMTSETKHEELQP